MNKRHQTLAKLVRKPRSHWQLRQRVLALVPVEGLHRDTGQAAPRAKRKTLAWQQRKLVAIRRRQQSALLGLSTSTTASIPEWLTNNVQLTATSE